MGDLFVLGDEGRGGGHDFTLFLLCILFGVAVMLGRGYMPWPQAAELNMITNNKRVGHYRSTGSLL